MIQNVISTRPGTQKTFNDVKNMYALHARTRIHFESYREIASVLYIVMKAVVTNKDVDIEKTLREAMYSL